MRLRRRKQKCVQPQPIPSMYPSEGNTSNAYLDERMPGSWFLGPCLSPLTPSFSPVLYSLSKLFSSTGHHTLIGHTGLSIPYHLRKQFGQDLLTNGQTSGSSSSSLSLPNARPHSLAMCPPVPHSECFTDGSSAGECSCNYLACRSTTEGNTGNLTRLMALGARVWPTQVIMLCFIYLELNCTKKNHFYIYVLPTH